MKKTIIILAIIILAIAAYLMLTTEEEQPTTSPPTENKTGENNTNLPLTIAEGFQISTLAENLPGARVMAIDGMGNMWVSRTKQGAITLLEIENNQAQNKQDIFTDLNQPHGLAIDPQDPLTLYYAETDKVSRVELYTDAKPEKIIDLPAGGRHFTRTIMFGPDNKLYISVGSSCDTCEEENNKRAAILRADKDGSNLEIFASGLRNAVFMTTHYVTGEMWATEMGRDYLGDNTPPDEINILKEKEHYGWPYCYGKQTYDSEFNKKSPEFCQQTEPSYIDIQAHSAPLGLDFIPEEGWPENYWYDLLVAYHGSWNRTEPTGYKVARFKLDAQGDPKNNQFERTDFISGWLTEDNEKLGRPVDILLQPGGIMYLSDDMGGRIYKITYQQ